MFGCIGVRREWGIKKKNVLDIDYSLISSFPKGGKQLGKVLVFRYFSAIFCVHFSPIWMNPRNEGIRPSLLCPPGPLQLQPLGFLGQDLTTWSTEKQAMKSWFIKRNKYYTRTLYNDVLLRPSMVQSKTGHLEDVVLSFLLIQWSLEEKHQNKTKRSRVKNLIANPNPSCTIYLRGKIESLTKITSATCSNHFFGDPTEKLGPI